MTDPNFISSEPRNKSFDENVRLFDLGESKAQKEIIDNLEGRLKKVCFNPYCNNRGSKEIEIVGTAADYRDHKIPYCVCEECFLPFIGWGPGRDHNESLKSIPELKICYNCNNEGKHWIDIYKLGNSESDPDHLWLGIGIKYSICEKCYAFFKYKRKDIYLLYNTIWGGNIDTKLKEEDRTGITVRDFCSLLESSRSDQETTTKNRSNTTFIGQVYEHKFTTQE